MGAVQSTQKACRGAGPVTQTHPITPPPALVQQWINEEDGLTAGHIAARAAQWGADQELEACCEWFQEFYKTESWVTHDLKHFRAARRPKPPSLKEQALEVVTGLEKRWDLQCDLACLRRALEALPND